MRSVSTLASFDPQAADFSGIDGTKAAAVTTVVFRVTSMLVTVVLLTIDRPFIFLIQDKPTGTILFLGLMFDAVQSLYSIHSNF